eukprot:230028-Pleurochrysis_carterae.AAC.1
MTKFALDLKQLVTEHGLRMSPSGRIVFMSIGDHLLSLIYETCNIKDLKVEELTEATAPTFRA